MLDVIVGILQEAGVEAEGLTVLLPSAGIESQLKSLPEGATVAVHDPADRSQMAYLAATKEGRRIYLNRHLTDADMVLPVVFWGSIRFSVTAGPLACCSRGCPIAKR